MSKESAATEPSSRYKPYPKYRSSDVEWLGEVPAHWEVKRLKFVAYIEAGQSPPSDLVTDGTNGLPFLQGNADFGPLNPKPRQICDEAPKRAYSGAILLSVRAPVGAMNMADQDYGIGRGLCAISPGRVLDSRFAFYFLSISRRQLDAVATGSTYDAVSTQRVGDLPTLLPEYPEQDTIGVFLDRETAKIDALVAKKEKLIELLKEKRAAFITQAVTKGLDPTAPMKDSEIEWIGEIPVDSKTEKLKYLVKDGLVNGLFKKKEQFGTGVKLINVVDLYEDNFLINFDALEYVETDQEELATFQVSPGDIFFVRSSLKREGIGSSACVATVLEPAVFECHLVRVRPSLARIRPRYLVYYLNSYLVRQRLIALAETTTMTTIAQPQLASLEIVVPCDKEQDAIVAHLDRESSKFEVLIAKVRDAIERLKEYRTALISAAVTGKIDVKKEVA
ncbi:MAG: Type I restriction enzyme, S subunit [Candidatus Nitrospira kreftii]|uniref:Type I restriction enzyme, S subunit n=1 Tax=Candidatus Nitrospira kreftii TaxID=2652173 RepID=A0A7S8FAD3_9BACT|nr:MAG: Type I restriction enzyme, S subunit [Candidatus Nitrospira kreftii]